MIFELFGLWTRFLDFFVDNRTIEPTPLDIYWMGGSVWDIVQGVGALATAGALITIIIQTVSIRKQSDSFEAQLEQTKKQTKLLQNDMDFRLRPWLYPFDTLTHMQLVIRVSNDSSKRVLDLRVEKSFKNEGAFPTKTVRIYVKGSETKIDNFNDGASMSDRSAIFPNQTFQVVSTISIKDLHLLDKIVIPGKDGSFERYKLNKQIYISILLEYEYGREESKREGFYQGLFRIDKLQHYDTKFDMIFSPLFDIVDEDVG